MGSKPITARAAAKVYANNVAKLNGTPSAGTLVNVGGQAAQLNPPTSQSYYTEGNETLIKGARGKSLRQAYDDALKLGYREESESFEDYAKRAKADPRYGQGTTPDRIESTPGFTTEIISQDYDLLEEKRDVYKPMQQRRAARAQKIAGRLYRQAERRFGKGKITEAERDAAKARLDAATEAAIAGRNVMTRATYDRPKSGTGLPEYQGGTTRRITMDSGNTYEITDDNPYGFNPDLGRGVSSEVLDKINKNPKATGQKKASSPIYKMGGYGSKAYKK
jgi:hypothetical protein